MPTKKSRTKPQYGQFRKAFKKWRLQYLKDAKFFAVEKEGIDLYDQKNKLIATYIAPGYTKYMAYQLRSIKRKRG